MKVCDENLYVVDDDPAVCDAIKWLFASVKIDVKIFNDGQSYLDNYHSSLRGCLLLDMRMPTMGGFKLLEELKKKGNQMPIIVITGHGDVPMAVRAMKEGVMDFILKPFDEEALLEKVQKAINLDKKRQKAVSSTLYKECLLSMTSRECEVLKLIGEGKLNKQIADQLNISTSTVEFHRANLMRKLKVRNVAELIKLYLLYSTTI